MPDYFISYNPESGEILSRRPSDMKYSTPVREPYIRVSEQEWYESVLKPHAVKDGRLVLKPEEPAAPADEGFIFNGISFPARQSSWQNRLRDAVILAMLKPERKIAIASSGNGDVDFDGAEVIKLFEAVQSFIEESYIKEEKLNVHINSH